MNDRIKKILEHLQVSNADFAKTIGIQPSNVSQVLSGRQNPSSSFLKKLLDAYPKINANWLITGHGEMFTSINTNQVSQRSLFSQDTEPNETKVEATIDTFDSFIEDKSIVEPTINKEERKIERIVTFFSDNTFIEYYPAK